MDLLQSHPFLEEDPSDDTNQMLSDVVSSLDITMKKLKESIPSGSKKGRTTPRRPKKEPTTRLKF